MDAEANIQLGHNSTFLSKLGILFLPVGLMTSYFSVQIPSVYTAKEYWASFAVLFGLSLLAVFFFGPLRRIVNTWI
jgi:Mg2+ and Co2+ transporter CorA